MFPRNVRPEMSQTLFFIPNNFSHFFSPNHATVAFSFVMKLDARGEKLEVPRLSLVVPLRSDRFGEDYLFGKAGPPQNLGEILRAEFIRGSWKKGENELVEISVGGSSRGDKIERRGSILLGAYAIEDHSLNASQICCEFHTTFLEEEL